jgi:hypothetical protein
MVQIYGSGIVRVVLKDPVIFAIKSAKPVSGSHPDIALFILRDICYKWTWKYGWIIWVEISFFIYLTRGKAKQ